MGRYSIMQIKMWVSEGPLASFVYLLHCTSVCFLLYKFQHFWAEECFKYIPGRVVLSYTEIFIYLWYSRKCSFLNHLNLFFPS